MVLMAWISYVWVPCAALRAEWTISVWTRARRDFRVPMLTLRGSVASFLVEEVWVEVVGSRGAREEVEGSCS